jgi:hypothetical protein
MIINLKEADDRGLMVPFDLLTAAAVRLFRLSGVHQLAGGESDRL